MAPKPSKWLFDIIGERHERNYRESFLSLDLFLLTFKNIFLALLLGTIAPSSAMDPPVTERNAPSERMTTGARYMMGRNVSGSG